MTVVLGGRSVEHRDHSTYLGLDGTEADLADPRVPGERTAKASAGVEELGRPPISELVCGFRFDRLPSLDTLHMGLFWARVREAFPTSELKTPLTDTPELHVGPARHRVWLTSNDGSLLLQLQDDRFYLNWRSADGEDYPRFHGVDGREGLLEQTLAHFAEFASFCAEELDQEPRLRSLELTKVNTLQRGDGWADARELTEFVPKLASTLEDATDVEPRFNVIVERQEEGRLLSSRWWSISSEQRIDRVLWEIRGTAPLATSRPSDHAGRERVLTGLNEQVNLFFFNCLSEQAFDHYGGGGR